MTDPRAPSLDDVLVVTVRKGFWAAPEAERFPRRVHVPALVGHSAGWINTALGVAKTLVQLFVRRPRLLLFGSAHRPAAIFLFFRRVRLIRTPIVATNKVFFGKTLAPYAARVIVYSRSEITDPAVDLYLPLPAQGDFDRVESATADRPYVFSGGGEWRDFPSLVAAFEGLELDLDLEVVTFSPEALGVEEPLPPNCRALWRMPLQEFLGRIAGALFVAVPLRAGDRPHGHTTVAQALVLGKAVVTTRGASVEDYVRDGVEGILVDPGDVAGYRAAVERMATDHAFRAACERRVGERAKEFSYSTFADSLEALCLELLAEISSEPGGTRPASRASNSSR